MSLLRGLLGAELRRFFSRRVMRGAFALGIALSTTVLVIITVRSDTASVRRSAPELVCPPGQGDTATTFAISPNGALPPGCSLQRGTGVVTRDRRIQIGKNYTGTVKGVGVAMIFVAFVIGASFIGGDFAAASLGSQLVFEPRRVRVVVVKGMAVAIGLAVMAAAILLYIGVLQWAGSSLRGVVSGLDRSWFAARAGDIGRVTATVALAGVATYAITVVARRTVAAVATLLVVGWASAIIGELVKWRWVARYNPASTFIVMALDPSRTSDSSGGHALSLGAATITSCAWAVGLTVIAAMVFARREVR